MLLIVMLALGIVMTALDYMGILTYTRLSQLLGLTESTPVRFDNSLATVHSIDVGQGDCTLIMSGGCTVLIDAGEEEAGPVVAEYLNKYGITRLDYVIATHPHSDHIGGLPFVMKNFPVGKLIAPKISEEMTPASKCYTRFLTAVKENGLRMTRAVPGESYTIGEGTLTILAPLRSDYDELNDFSVVCRFDCADSSFLFTGDAEKIVEEELCDSGADLSADVLKVGHHGSSTSTRAPFLDAVSAKYAVIYCGKDNSFNHPNTKTMKRLDEYGLEIYRTDLQGDIIFVTDGKTITAEVEHNAGS